MVRLVPNRCPPALVVALATALLPASAAAAARSLPFESRLAAQEAIQRVYRSHQIGADDAVEATVPRRVLEQKVRGYLMRSAALERFWSTPVTAEALERELARIARSTRLPGRLHEVYRALDDDAFLVQECFARPALVDRLARSFFAYDGRIHAAARTEAEDVRRWMARGRLGVREDDPRWTVIDLVRRSPGAAGGRERPGRSGEPVRVEVSPDEFLRWRAEVPSRPREVGPVVEHRDAFTIGIVLEERDGFARIGTYSVPKRSWDDWWAEVESMLERSPVAAVASPDIALPVPGRASSSFEAEAATACQPQDLWNNGALDDIPEPRTNHVTIWTGTEVVVWGGSGIAGPLDSGARYDALINLWVPTTKLNAPSPRRSPSAVWTGTEVLIWGGTDGLVQDTGGRYDPVTDSWTPITTSQAPAARSDHSAVWTGSEMVVWGGRTGDLAFFTGGRYRPDTDTWTPMTVVGAPNGRGGHVAVWTGDTMVVWGGIASGVVNTGGRYDPVDDTWMSTTLTGAPVTRFRHTAVWTGTEMIVWGGSDTVAALNSGGRYDPGDDTWIAPTRDGAPARRQDHTAVWTGTRMIIWGGASGSNLDTGGLYDPGTDSWTPTGAAGVPSPRSLHSAAWTGDLMVVWGGAQAGGFNTSGGRYDPVSGSWTPTATASGQTGREDHSAIWTGTEMLVWGGFDTLPPNYVMTGGRYDPLLDSWTDTSTADAPEGRELHLAAWTGTEMLVWGGFNGSEDLNTGGLYDPLLDSWLPTSPVGALSSRNSPSAVWTGDEMIIWGGLQQAVFLQDGARYDPVADDWDPLSQTNPPTERFLHSAVWTGSEMLVWGGSTPSGVTTSGGRYDPATNAWSFLSSTGAPQARNRHTAVWTGTEMIVWGGFGGGSHLDSGGRYDPGTDTWVSLPTTDGPSARLEHTAVWTGDHMLIWGGFDGSPLPFLGDGGQYDPITDAWIPIALENAPSPRSNHSAVWIDDSMVIWGGSDGSVLNNGGRLLLGGLPGEATGLAFGTDAQTLSWTAALGVAVTHDLLRGLAAELPVGSGAGEMCLGSGLGESAVDTAVPTVGDTFWYLTRGANDCGGGPYGFETTGDLRTSTACP